MFSDLFGKTYSELLLNFTTSEEIIVLDTKKSATFISKHSRNRFGREKAEQIQSAAESSFDLDCHLTIIPSFGPSVNKQANLLTTETIDLNATYPIYEKHSDKPLL